MTRRCVLASGNQGKLREFAQLLLPLQMQVIDQTSLGIAACPEPHFTFLENALEKARHAARQSGLSALADDSGICLPSLGGAPGVVSARFAQSLGLPLSHNTSVDENNNLALVSCVAKKMVSASADLIANEHKPASFDEAQIRKAYYVCVLVYLRSATDPQPLIAQATWWGQFVDVPSGEGGFGYDAHFYLPEHRCTVAQLPPERKNQISHRAQAMQQLVVQMQNAID
jgi:XTP/dITP diphosphohydrolase